MAILLDDVAWIHGAADCVASTDPLLQVHQVDDDMFVLRQSKCFSFEAPFMYLLFGRERALLLDTGAGPDAAGDHRVLPIRATIDRLVNDWARRNGRAPHLVVAHTHSHRDHAFWDGQFVPRQDTTIVGLDGRDIQRFFGLPQWPAGQAVFDLGNRQLTVLPLPGHESTHIAVYDRRTQALFTGDTLYPGLLTVQDWPTYVRSAARLAAFANANAVSVVLGNHIEMKRTPGAQFPIGARFQPNEHALPLTVDHLREWQRACEAMANSPHTDVHRDFIIGAP
jgi:hydroxyacylglutathione hydrolase